MAVSWILADPTQVHQVDERLSNRPIACAQAANEGDELAASITLQLREDGKRVSVPCRPLAPFQNRSDFRQSGHYFDISTI